MPYSIPHSLSLFLHFATKHLAAWNVILGQTKSFCLASLIQAWLAVWVLSVYLWYNGMQYVIFVILNFLITCSFVSE